MKIEDLIVRYGAITHRRFYEKEKRKFLVAITKEFQQLGYQVDAKVAKKGQFKAYNLYVGNVEKAEKIITTYYDTPAKTFGLFPYKVLGKKGRSLAIFISTIVPMLMVILLGSLFIQKVVGPIWSDNVFQFKDVLVGIVTLLLLGGVFYYRRGIGNRSNLVRNTSSIIALISFAEKLSKKDKEKFAFVLTDFGCLNYFGEEMVKSYLGKQQTNKKFIMLDSIGSNNELILLSSAKLREKAEKAGKAVLGKSLKIIDLDAPNAHQQKIYENNLVITSGVLKDDEVVVEKTNTRKDNDLHPDNIYRTVKLLKEISVL